MTVKLGQRGQLSWKRVVAKYTEEKEKNKLILDLCMYFLEKNYKQKKTVGIKLIALHMWVYNGLCILHRTFFAFFMGQELGKREVK